MMGRLTSMSKVFPILLLLGLFANVARAQGIAYGSITNFDTVNDTGKECHGFEIELEDCHSTEIGSTYNYNHYGVPRITEDNSNAAHPVCRIRWESRKNPDGSWAAFTAIPSGPISPTNGHQFTNPSVNFGGEHFGVSYRVQPTAIRYFWLVDDGAGTLVRGGQVQVAAPTFQYFPPVAAQPARVQAAIEPPEPPEIHAAEFGPALWVKEIRTTTHNNREVSLRDLVSDDPDDPDDRNWRNGEPDEIEVEWMLLQTEFSKPGEGNGRLEAEAEPLENGDEVVTRRYEFFEYIGPTDEESGEASADNVGPDGVHGAGVKIVNGVEVDLSLVEVVGEFKGAQMAAVIVDASVGLIEHLADGILGEPYADRSVVIPGNAPFQASGEGTLPQGLSFDPITGILTGTPEETGHFDFVVTASEEGVPAIEKAYHFAVWESGAEAPPAILVDTTSEPVEGGETTGGGSFALGDEVSVTANALPGFVFAEWIEDGQPVSGNVSHTFSADVNHSLVARFEAAPAEPLPDLTIGNFPSIRIGDGVYNLNGIGQTVRQVLSRKRKAAVFFDVQNDGAAAASIVVSASGRDRLFDLRYYDLAGGRQNVTADLTRAGLVLAFDGIGGRSFLAEVVPGRRLRRGNKAIVVSAGSEGVRLDVAKSFLKFK